MGLRGLAFRREDRPPKPIANRPQVIFRQPFQIGSANTKETAAGIHNRGQVVTVREEDTFAYLISQAHERGKLLPR